MPSPGCRKWPGLPWEDKKAAAEDQFFGGSSFMLYLPDGSSLMDTGFHTIHNKTLEILMHHRLQAASLIGKLIVRQENMQIHPLFSQYTANPVNILRKKLI